MEIHKLNQYKITVLFIISICFICFGILILSFLKDLDHTQENSISQISYNDLDCIFRILGEESLFLNKEGKVVHKIQCKNQNLQQLPIIRSAIQIQKEKNVLNDLFSSLITIYKINPTVLNAISEISIFPKEVHFFLHYHKIRIDIRDYNRVNWEEKMISMIIWLYNQKERRKGFLEITEKDSLLIVYKDL